MLVHCPQDGQFAAKSDQYISECRFFWPLSRHGWEEPARQASSFWDWGVQWGQKIALQTQFSALAAQFSIRKSLPAIIPWCSESPKRLHSSKAWDNSAWIILHSCTVTRIEWYMFFHGFRRLWCPDDTNFVGMALDGARTQLPSKIEELHIAYHELHRSTFDYYCNYR